MQKTIAKYCIVLVAMACSGPTEPPPVASISVTAQSTTIASGATLQLSVATLRKDGKPLTDRVVAWSSSNPNLASVSATGLVTASFVLGGASESVTISAAVEGIVGAISISITPSPVATITIEPASSTLAKGERITIAVTNKDAQGNILTGRNVVFSSSDPTKVTASAAGEIHATGSVGNVNVTIQSEGVSRTHTATLRCGVQTLSLAVPLSGSIDSTDCPSRVANLTQDHMRLSLSKASVIKYSITSGSAIIVAIPMLGDTTVGPFAESNWTSAVSGETFGAIYPAGFSKTILRQATTAPTTYAVNAIADSTFTDGCNLTPLVLLSAVTFSHRLAETSCTDGTWYSNLYAVFIAAGKTLIARQASQEVDSFICTVGMDAKPILCNDNESNTGPKTALISFSASSDTTIVLYSSTFGRGEKGYYTLETTVTSGAGQSLQMDTLSAYRKEPYYVPVRLPTMKERTLHHEISRLRRLRFPWSGADND